jgi:hypothetical protein
MSISVDWGACGAVLRLDRRQAVARPWARLVQVAASRPAPANAMRKLR